MVAAPLFWKESKKPLFQETNSGAAKKPLFQETNSGAVKKPLFQETNSGPW